MTAPAAPFDLTQHPQARRVRKKPVDVQVRFAREPGILATLEGPVHYLAGAALLTGGGGDRWPVERAKFDAAYAPQAGLAAGADGIYRKRPIDVLALRLTAPAQVSVSPAGDTLRGQSGDWLLQYGPGDFGIVAAAIFEATYDAVADRPAAGSAS